MRARCFFRFHDKIRQPDNRLLLMRQQAWRIRRTQRGRNQIQNRFHSCNSKISGRLNTFRRPQTIKLPHLIFQKINQTENRKADQSIRVRTFNPLQQKRRPNSLFAAPHNKNRIRLAFQISADLRLRQLSHDNHCMTMMLKLARGSIQKYDCVKIQSVFRSSPPASVVHLRRVHRLAQLTSFTPCNLVCADNQRGRESCRQRTGFAFRQTQQPSRPHARPQ